MTVEWKGDEIERQLRARLSRNMAQAALYLKGEVRKSINRSQPFRRTAKGDLVGLDPSKPGEPPKKLSSILADSIATDQRESPLEITGVVGTNVDYAKRLELGFTGTDSAGRVVDQAPRPFLRPALEASAKVIRQILAKP